MSLNVTLRAMRMTEIFRGNYTHNVGKMASAAGIYQAVWRPEELGITLAGQLIEPLRAGVEKMESDPDKFKKLNPANGWGSYAPFLAWLKEYLAACEENPLAEVSVSI